MDVVLVPLVNLIYTVLYLYMWIVIIHVIVSWLVSFEIINTQNQIAAGITNFLYNVTEPCLQPIRRVLPNLGGLDFAPLVLVLILYFFQMVLDRLALHIRVAHFF
jgi:YggT family protein